jgi:fumarate reductase subunit C
LLSPWSLAFHLVLLASFIYHTWSWFSIMPKTMPMILIGGKRLQPGVITGVGLAVSAVACVALFLLVMKLAS